MDKRHLVLLLLLAGLTLLLLGFQLGKYERASEVPSDHASMTMDEMTAGLQGKMGDEFDKAFVEMMIVHHEGAVEMAKLIPAQGKHAELKELGKDIIEAQTKEIEMMKRWLVDWGYTSDGASSHMGH